MIRFVWNDEKARVNATKHGVTFEDAVAVFDDPRAIVRLDDRFDYGEPRYLMIGMVKTRVLVVVHVERGDTIRLISARKAERSEIDVYVTGG